LVKHVAFAVPGELQTLTGGYAYDRRIVAEMKGLGWNVETLSLGEGFPFPSAKARALALSRLVALPEGVPVIVDGLALGALPEEAEKVSRRAPLIALVHHPLALETGLSRAEAQALLDSERRALAAARLVIVNSPSTAARVSDDYGVAMDRIAVAPPGTDRGEPAKGSSDGTVRLLSVGAVVPRKGFGILIAALAPIAKLPWRLTIAGDLARDGAEAAKLKAALARYKLSNRVELLGAVQPERLPSLYSGADIFVLASHFEGYGMAYAEAMAHGLPIVGTWGGATIDTVPSGAGFLVEPDNTEALTRALKFLIENEGERRNFAAGALAAAGQLPTWEGSARIVASALENLA
jgi:glycosyltransferase involved in cell wall biosynthesis